jgi:hypothetical protein
MMEWTDGFRRLFNSQRSHVPRQGPFTIERTGLSPIVVEGPLIAEVAGSRERSVHLSAWLDLRLYRDTAHGYVIEIVHRARTAGARSTHLAYSVPNADDVVLCLRSYDPARHLSATLNHPLAPQELNYLPNLVWDVFQARVARLCRQASSAESAAWPRVSY